ncbi:MAG: hypothetical protein MZW92_11510 [Comamonadaceae bacterium]|nr:hypothetical protein [Comamonadaceae bacterium]
MGDRFAFARGFVAHPAQVGSVVPSSTFLEQRLVRAANLEQARTVVELGPGTGGTTRALLRALRPDARLLAIELSAAFHARLLDNIADSRVAMQLGSAEQLAEYLRDRRLPSADVVLSGIPVLHHAGRGGAANCSRDRGQPGRRRPLRRLPGARPRRAVHHAAARRADGPLGMAQRAAAPRVPLDQARAVTWQSCRRFSLLPSPAGRGWG